MGSETLKNNLMHAQAAYLHAVRALPLSHDFCSGPIDQNGMTFSNIKQVESQLVELGWAFFCRYEGCLEKWLKDHNVRLSKTVSLKQWLTNRNVSIPNNLSDGMDVYRKIRNALHHADGAIFDGSGEPEFHLLQSHMENFFYLFCWIGQQVEKVNPMQGSPERRA